VAVQVFFRDRNGFTFFSFYRNFHRTQFARATNSTANIKAISPATLTKSSILTYAHKATNLRVVGGGASLIFSAKIKSDKGDLFKTPSLVIVLEQVYIAHTWKDAVVKVSFELVRQTTEKYILNTTCEVKTLVSSIINALPPYICKVYEDYEVPKHEIFSLRMYPLIIRNYK
jgi:hypothetical protein